MKCVKIIADKNIAEKIEEGLYDRKKYDDGHKNENMTISFSKLNNK